MCNDPELILGYVYGELPEADRRAFDAHIATCAHCRDEVAALRATRGHLAAWTPPEPDFGFRIVRGSSAPAPPARRWLAPAWGLAAAAVLVLATAATIANVEVRYDANGLVVRTGWAGDAAAPQNAASTAPGETPVALTPEQWQSEIATVKARLRELEAAAASRPAAGTPLASGPRLSDAEMLRRVRELVEQGDRRQQQEFTMQIAQVVRDIDNAVQLNNARIWQGLGQHRKQTSAEAAETVNYILRTALQQK